MIEELRLQCLYKVTLNTETSIYSFITKNNIEYDIVFTESNNYYKGTSRYSDIKNVYSIFVVNKTNDLAPKDTETKCTIDAVLQYFFRDTEKVLLYECETKDNRANARYRTFNLWFNNSSIRNQLLKIDKPIKDIEGKTHFTSLIYHKDNSFKESLIISHNEVLDFISK